jgi:hypothetical protein
VNFTGVAFDPERLAKLPTSGLDLPQMIGQQVEVLKEPRQPVSYTTAEEAGVAAGLRVRTPAYLPPGFEFKSADVAGDGEIRFTANTANLRLLLDALAIGDVTIPDGVDGQPFQVRVPPVVHLTYGRTEHDRVMLTESRTPDISFPAGLDPAALGEIGLRILGLSRSEAYRIAQSVDWRTTLVVPVPVTAASFRQINIQGETALVIEANRREPHVEGPGTVILWSQQGVVYAVVGMRSTDELIEIAQTLQ